ncbi:MAG: enoyl-CoA hydratase-related protein, partial [Alphaproteobacteria bacterium]
AFCAGGDIQSMRDNADADGSAAVFLKTLTVPLHGAIATLARMQKPVIAAVNGVAAGAGFSIALACDLILATESAKFTMAYTRIGAVPDGSSTYFLPRAVGFKRAYDLIVNNRVLSAAEARDMGIVSEIFADGEFADQALAYTQRLAAGPTLALGRAKQLLTSSGAETLETQMEHERRAIAASGATADFIEGTKAFLAKRKPDFTGS